MATTTKDTTTWTLPTSLPPWAVLVALLVGPAGSGAFGAWAGQDRAAVDRMETRMSALEQGAVVQPVTERRISELEHAVARVDDQLGRIGTNQIKICVALKVSCRE